jgi:hypothetical protein
MSRKRVGKETLRALSVRADVCEKRDEADGGRWKKWKRRCTKKYTHDERYVARREFVFLVFVFHSY